MCMADVNVVDTEVDKSVMELVDHIWTEATGHLDDILSVPASNITPEQVTLSYIVQVLLELCKYVSVKVYVNCYYSF